MVIYIESVFAFNVLVDYLLLFGAARVAGRTVARRRLLLGAAVGGIYAAVQLFLPKSVVLLLLGLALMGAAAYRGSGRAVKLTLLFFLASCGLAGVVMLLGHSLGSMARLARGVVTAGLPWGVFLIAAGTSYLLLSVVFRYGAARTGSETADVVIAYRGKTARVRLLRDTGNTLCDPVTGLGVPVIDRHALGDLISEEETATLPHIAYCSVGNADGTLPLLRCEAITVDEIKLGSRAVALAERSATAVHMRDCGAKDAKGGRSMESLLKTLWCRLRFYLIDWGLIARRGIFYIGGSDTLPPPLEREKEAELIARMDEGDESVRGTLIEHNLRLVAYIARRFENTGINIEDLISIGTIGLIKAVNTYRSDKNIKLATYASRCIENEILMHLRKTAPQKSEVSFDEPLNTDWDGNELLLSDILGTDEDLVLKPIEDDVDRQLLMDAVDKLTARERTIITLRFGLGGREEKTQKEVADLMGISQSYISRLEKRIIVRLKKEILKMS